MGGEHKASRALRHAAEVIAECPAALQLRYLQTLNSISAENNSTIVFPVPIDIMSSFMSSKDLQSSLKDQQQAQQMLHVLQQTQHHHHHQMLQKTHPDIRQQQREVLPSNLASNLASRRQGDPRKRNDVDDIEIPEDSGLSIDLDIPEIDLKIAEGELIVSG